MVNHFFGLISAAHLSQLISAPQTTCIYISLIKFFTFHFGYSSPRLSSFLGWLANLLLAPRNSRHLATLHYATRPSRPSSHLAQMCLSSVPAYSFSAVSTYYKPIDFLLVFFPYCTIPVSCPSQKRRPLSSITTSTLFFSLFSLSHQKDNNDTYCSTAQRRYLSYPYNYY
jgi:hypothetical protein